MKISMGDIEAGTPRRVLHDLFGAALAAADPMGCVPGNLPEVPEQGRVVVVGAGKASAAMAKAV